MWKKNKAMCFNSELSTIAKRPCLLYFKSDMKKRAIPLKARILKLFEINLFEGLKNET